MGQDVSQTRFERRDFARFERRVRAETEHLHDLIEGGRTSARGPVAGLELEAWLIDRNGQPAPRNAELLEALGSPDVVTELGRFNVELNVPPREVAGDGLRRLADDLGALWRRCQARARDIGLQALAIGILPTLRDSDLHLGNLSERARYRALNEQVLRQRHGRPVRLDIEGHAGALHCEHRDVMLESAATSFQVHLQLPSSEITRAYNASLIAAAPLVALSANSPLLFGQALWQETRIPLFEQALSVGSREDGARHPLGRVGFGSGYLGYSVLECFRENVERFEPLLPLALDEPAERMPHLRLHNGTIWRWTRPIVGFDADGCPHLRIEHRPMAAGTSIEDLAAQLAFAVGLIAHLARCSTPPEAQLPFEQARDNFYRAARDGLDAELLWPGQPPQKAADLLGALLRPARDAVIALGAAPACIDGWFTLLESRVALGCNGSNWQLAELDRHAGDLAAMTRRYAELQASGEPLHRWPGVCAAGRRRAAAA